MNELIRHIEALLQEYDCVIIPGFGGFIASYSPARWVESENLYLPPARRVGFNAQLTHNDGLLVQSYMKHGSNSFAAATDKMAQDVAALKQALHEKGEARIGGLGQLKMNLGNTCLFEPDENGLTTPDLYGLDAFRIEKLQPSVTGTAMKQPLERNGRTPAKRIPMHQRWLPNTVAAAAAVIAFFILSVPIENTYIETGSYATLSPVATIGMHPAANAGASRTAAMEAQQPMPPKTVRTEKVPAATARLETGKKATATGEKQYHIIIASASNRQTAEKIMDECAQMGYTQLSILEGDGRMRVCLMSFPKKHEAYGALQRIKGKTPFKDAWILRK